MDSLRIPTRFWFELVQLTFLSHFAYSVIFYLIAALFGRYFEFSFGLIGITVTLVTYFAPIPVLIFIFVRLEKKELMDQASGVKQKTEGFFAELGNYLGESIVALIFAFLIYLPFIFLSYLVFVFGVFRW